MLYISVESLLTIGLNEYWVGGFPGEGPFYAEHGDAGVNEAAENKDSLRTRGSFSEEQKK